MQITDSFNDPSNHASSVAYGKEFLADVLELIHLLPAFGLLGKMDQVFPC